MRRWNSIFFVFSLLLGLACTHPRTPDPVPGSHPPEETEDPEPDTLIITDWTEATHGKHAPDYPEVLPQDNVNTIEIRMKGADWTTVQANMKALFGFGFGEPMKGQPFPGDDPQYIAVSLKYNGRQWYKVGFRLKGNSSLSNSWSAGVYKLPFRLNFDRFEDDYPLIKDQRFYGFKEVSLSPGFRDRSLLREKCTSDIFRMAGIASSQTAFYKVFIDFGAGLKYCGVYTMVEVVDDTLVKNAFGEDHGNIYKPESNLSSFAIGEFEKKNNEGEGDYGDVEAFIAALNSTTRVSDPAVWRLALEQTFDVDHFLKWLAVNTALVNWDTYGVMPHNYYLYNRPGNGLTWIPWDNNEALKEGNSNPQMRPIPLSLAGVGSGWPLIRYIADDPVYFSRYRLYVQNFEEQVFTIDKMEALFARYHTMISPFVIGPEQVEEGKYSQLAGPGSFAAGLTEIRDYMENRHEVIESFLNK